VTHLVSVECRFFFFFCWLWFGVEDSSARLSVWWQ
jgi:hypothetical protein